MWKKLRELEMVLEEGEYIFAFFSCITELETKTSKSRKCKGSLCSDSGI